MLVAAVRCLVDRVVARNSPSLCLPISGEHTLASGLRANSKSGPAGCALVSGVVVAVAVGPSSCGVSCLSSILLSLLVQWSVVVVVLGQSLPVHWVLC